jgi:hypothetical protein
VVHYNRPERLKSIQDLHAILAAPETKKASDLFRALTYQWLAFNHVALENADSVTFYVARSLKEYLDIWPGHLESQLPEEVQTIYQNSWREIVDRFNKKRKSYRFAAGAITRLDYSHRVAENWDAAAGIGTTVVLFEEIRDLIEKNVDYKTELFNDLLVYVRVQRMRKHVESLTAGFYLEFALTEELKEPGITFSPVFSGGPILSYAYQSGWEIGGAFEIARLVFGREINTKFSQTVSNKNENVAFSYGNFELYVRKWF